MLLLLLFTACASAPEPRPFLSLPEARSPAGFQVQYVNQVADPALTPIGKRDLEEARALLSRARQELQPEQWELLDRTLAEAERAWDRHDALARESGKSAEVPRAPSPVVALVGVRAAAVETTAVAGLGPLFAVLGALWPASVANGTLTPLNVAYLELEKKLRDVVEAAGQVKAELETSKPPSGTVIAAADRPRECRPIPVYPHLGGDDIHNTCADVFPPNRFPKHDVLVMGSGSTHFRLAGTCSGRSRLIASIRTTHLLDRRRSRRT